MQSAIDGVQVSTASLWAGRILSGLMVIFLVFDGVIHLLKIDPVVKAFAQLGLPLNISVPIGIVLLFCVFLYIVPRTSVLGAVLLTGYLGGAVLTQLRVGSSLFGQVLFPVYMGVMLWAGLLLRDRALRTIFPLRG